MTTSMHTLALFQNLGPFEIMIILGVGLLLFGRRLPEVGRSLGRSIVEFKRGLNSVNDDIDEAAKKPGKSELPAGDSRTVSQSSTSSAKTV